MRVELKRIGDKIDFTNLVGKESVVLDKTTMIYSWDNDRKELGIIINDMEGNRVGTETISLAFGLVTFIEKLEAYGFNAVITDGISYSVDTKNKAQGLIQAGFSKLIKADSNYMVDSIFQQNILLEDELQYLLSNNISEINLSEIK